MQTIKQTIIFRKASSGNGM